MPLFQRAWIRSSVITLLALTLVCMDWLAGPLVQTSLLYIFPIGLAAWFLGERWGILFALGLSGARAYFALRYWGDTVPTELALLNLGIRSAVYILIAELVTRHARLHRMQSRRFDLILEHLPIGVGICDAMGKIVSVNPAEKEIWGEILYVDSPNYGQYRGRLHDSDHDLTAQEWALARTLETGESVLNEVVDIEAFDGSRKTILNSTVMLKDELDRPIGAIFVNQDITSEMDRIREKEALISSLEEAMANIKVLKGLLPICASCKKVRDDNGYWNQIEVYLRENTELDFSHGICPDCAARLYPEFAIAAALPRADSSAQPAASKPPANPSPT
jgi:PAS domain-containing protein